MLCDWCQEKEAKFLVLVTEMGSTTTAPFSSALLCPDCMKDVRLGDSETIFDDKSHQRPNNL